MIISFPSTYISICILILTDMIFHCEFVACRVLPCEPVIYDIAGELCLTSVALCGIGTIFCWLPCIGTPAPILPEPVSSMVCQYSSVLNFSSSNCNSSARPEGHCRSPTSATHAWILQMADFRCMASTCHLGWRFVSQFVALCVKGILEAYHGMASSLTVTEHSLKCALIFKHWHNPCIDQPARSS